MAISKKEFKFGKGKKGDAAAIHAKTTDGEHVVGIGNLRVMIVPDGKFWFAQGLEIDYAAQGSSIQEAKTHFEAGLEATISQHLRVYGNIEKLLRVAPVEVWHEALLKKATKVERYWQVSFHTVGPAMQGVLPFEGISYLVSKAAA